ncbi:hypothetical protein Tco_0719938 [Tanacetum coccineum]
MDDTNITMEECIRLEEEKAQRHGQTFKWQTATYGKIKYCEDENDCFTNFKTEFPAIVFDDTLTSDIALSCESTVSPLNKNEFDFRISFDESDDEDYMTIFDENSFSYKIISVDDLKTDSKKDNDKIDMPSSPEPTISHSDDLDFFKDFENEFPAITYNDDLTSKLTEPSVNMAPLPPRDQRHLWLRYQVEGYTKDIGRRQTLAGRLRMVYTGDEGQELFTSHAWRRLFKIRAPLVQEFLFELGGVRRKMTWRQFIMALGLHTVEEMAKDGFGAYWGQAPEKVTGVTPRQGRNVRRNIMGYHHNTMASIQRIL